MGNWNYEHANSHFNGNLFCAVDIETTGLHFPKHDIIQISIIPIAPDLSVNKKLPFFHCLIKPRRPENISEEANTVTRGIVAAKGNDLLLNW